MKLPLKNINHFYMVAVLLQSQNLLMLIYVNKALNKQFLAFHKSNKKKLRKFCLTNSFSSLFND